MNRERKVWTLNHWSRLERLLGRPEGNFQQFAGPCSHGGARRFFVNIIRPRLRGLMTWSGRVGSRRAGEDHRRPKLARYKGVRASLDPGIIEQDRREASDRCLFDLQPAMSQVRKYEAATERAMYKALKEFRALEGP